MSKRNFRRLSGLSVFSDGPSDDKFAEFKWAGTLFLISTIVAVVSSWLSSDKFTLKNIDDIVITSFIIFMAGLLFPILKASRRIEPWIKELREEMQQLRQTNSVQNDITQTVLKVFEYQGEPAHEAAAGALADHFKIINVSDNEIYLAGDYLSRTFYEKFWEQLISAQTRVSRSGGNAQNIIAYVTHSAPVRLWDSSSFERLRQSQERFCKLGGKIVRILLHQAGNNENEDNYLSVMKDMLYRKIDVYYLDTRNEQSLNDDYLMVHFDNEFYVMYWYPGWSADGIGTVSGCRVWVGVEDFSNRWHKWVTILEKLMRKPTNLQTLLGRRPSDSEINAWKTHPRER